MQCCSVGLSQVRVFPLWHFFLLQGIPCHFVIPLFFALVDACHKCIVMRLTLLYFTWVGVIIVLQFIVSLEPLKKHRTSTKVRYLSLKMEMNRLYFIKIEIYLHSCILFYNYESYDVFTDWNGWIDGLNDLIRVVCRTRNPKNSLWHLKYKKVGKYFLIHPTSTQSLPWPMVSPYIRVRFKFPRPPGSRALHHVRRSFIIPEISKGRSTCGIHHDVFIIRVQLFS